ncbi:MAG: hypothetical protein CMO81_06450 [Waddliaceae bacterium]|nr:hypothetical protein [Waddliaceae bacterium]
MSNASLRRMRKHRSKIQLQVLCRRFFYSYVQDLVFPKRDFETLYYATISTQVIMGLCYASSAIFLLSSQGLFWGETQEFSGYISFAAFVIFLSISLFLGDFLPRAFGARYPNKALLFSAPITSVYLVICFPVAIIYLKLTKWIWKNTQSQRNTQPVSQLKEKVIELIQEATVNTHLDPSEKKLIASVVTFKDRIVRGVMVPRVNVFSLPSNFSIKEAAHLLREHGYSRTPIYQDSVDNVIGVLMYKDILDVYMECMDSDNFESLSGPISGIVKPILFTPETQKISHLLQEFRRKQMHLAVVVDEYGGTEGIVTIEDILEEIVGEIADEYDDQESEQFSELAEGGWVVDASMSINDVSEKLGVIIPQDGEYDTIGGYIFHRTGSIPEKGFVIIHDNFEMEVLSSNERCIEQVKVRPSNGTLFPPELPSGNEKS